MTTVHERPISFNQELKIYYFNCPNCDGLIEVKNNELNCRIFRHGVYVKGPLGLIGQPMNPHETKEKCEKMVDEQEILGCGKPFKMNENLSIVQTCDYC